MAEAFFKHKRVLLRSGKLFELNEKKEGPYVNGPALECKILGVPMVVKIVSVGEACPSDEFDEMIPESLSRAFDNSEALLGLNGEIHVYLLNLN